MDRIRDIADPILAYWQLRMVRHPVIGLPLWVPFGLGLNQISTRSGFNFETANKIAAISFNFFPHGELVFTPPKDYRLPSGLQQNKGQLFLQ